MEGSFLALAKSIYQSKAYGMQGKTLNRGKSSLYHYSWVDPFACSMETFNNFAIIYLRIKTKTLIVNSAAKFLNS